MVLSIPVIPLPGHLPDTVGVEPRILKHIILCIKNPDLKIACEICGAKSKTMDALRQHKKSHRALGLVPDQPAQVGRPVQDQRNLAIKLVSQRPVVAQFGMDQKPVPDQKPFMMSDHKGMDRLVGLDGYKGGQMEEHRMAESHHRLNSPVSEGVDHQRHFLSKLGGADGPGSSTAGAEVLDHQRQFLSKLGGVEMPKLVAGEGVHGGVGSESLEHQRHFLSKLGGMQMDSMGHHPYLKSHFFFRHTKFIIKVLEDHPLYHLGHTQLLSISPNQLQVTLLDDQGVVQEEQCEGSDTREEKMVESSQTNQGEGGSLGEVQSGQDKDTAGQKAQVQR